MLDEHGFRPNVGIILTNGSGKVLLGERKQNPGEWQFPQGGVDKEDTDIKAAMYRELYEELGLRPEHVEEIAQTQDWIAYTLPQKFIRYSERPICYGQKQKYFLLKLVAPESAINLNAFEVPEFISWKWVDPSEPVKRIIDFKQDVYERALKELEGFL